MRKKFRIVFTVCMVVLMGAALKLEVFAFTGTGAGTAASPFIITRPAQIAEISNNLTAHYRLGNDIDMTGINHTPIGLGKGPFKGVLDGNGFKILNLKIDMSTASSIGFFNIVDSGSIKNISFDNAMVTGKSNVGLIAGQFKNSQQSLLINIENCVATGWVQGSGNSVGGIIGQVVSTGNPVKIERVSLSVQVTPTSLNSTGMYYGGLIGQANGKFEMRECSNTMYLQCYSYGGGLIGYNSVNSNSSIIENCYTSGGLSITNPSGYWAGICPTNNSTWQIKNTYSMRVNNNRITGNAWGMMPGASITSSYFNRENAAINTPAAQARTSAQLETQTNYAGWDFNNIWILNKTPMLRQTGFIEGTVPSIARLENAVKTNNSLAFRWNNAGASYIYQIEFKKVGGNAVQSFQKENTVTFNDLEPNTEYQIKVRSSFTQPYASPWATLTVSTAGDLTAPLELKVEDIQPTTAELSWQAVPEATEYIIELAEAAKEGMPAGAQPNETHLEAAAIGDAPIEALTIGPAGIAVSGEGHTGEAAPIRTIVIQAVPSGTGDLSAAMPGEALAADLGETEPIDPYYRDLEARMEAAMLYGISPEDFEALLAEAANGAASIEVQAETAASLLPIGHGETLPEAPLPGSVITIDGIADALPSAEIRLGEAISGESSTAEGIVTLEGAAGENILAEAAADAASAITTTVTTLTDLTPGTAYTVKVKAKNTYTESPFSEEVYFETLFYAPPEDFLCESKDATNIRLAWGEADYATGYEILHGEDVFATEELFMEFSGLEPHTEYRFQLRAIYGDVEGPWSEALIVTTDEMVLEQPVNLRLVHGTHRSILLEWDPVSNAEAYVINWDGGTATFFDNRGLIENLSPDRDYIFVVIAKNDYAQSESAEISVRTRPEPVPLASLTGLTCTGKTYTSVVLSWEAVAEATEYEVIYNGQALTTATTTLTINNLQPDTDYIFKVKGQNAYTAGPYTELSVRTETPSIGIPLNLRCTDKTQTSISLAWDAVAEATEYVVNYGDKSIIAQATSITIGGLTHTTEYDISVQAKNEYITGAAGQVITVKTYPEPFAAVTGLKYTNRTNSSVSLAWNPMPQAEAYQVKFGETVISCENPETVISGLSPQTRYEFSVRAYTSENVGEWSAPLGVTTLRGTSSLNSEIQLNAQNDKTYEVIIAGDYLSLSENDVFTITYDPAVLTLVDFASHVPGSHASTGAIPGTDIHVLSISNGEIRFRLTRQLGEHQVWSGILTIAKFKATSTRNTTVFIEQ